MPNVLLTNEQGVQEVFAVPPSAHSRFPSVWSGGTGSASGQYSVPDPPKRARPTKIGTFMRSAYLVGQLGTCDRARVGVSLVHVDHIVAQGYNGAISGEAHCDDVGHDIQNNHCVRAAHAEANAIAFAAKQGIQLLGCTAYITIYPCWTCTKLLFAAGIRRIVYGERYAVDERVEDLASRGRISIEKWLEPR